MSKYYIKIRLLSDLCVSDGGIYNSAIDTDVCYDSSGFPYIPAKRIKGCLRECAKELNDWGKNIPVNEMFGTQGNQRASVIIRDAYLPDRNFLAETTEEGICTQLFHPQNILRTFTSLRNQTAINYDTGVAEDASLRTMRVVNKGLVFYAEVDFGNYQKELEECLAVFRHMGLARTRGLGEIQASLEKKNDGNESREQAAICMDGNQLEYEIYLKSPVICKSVNGQEANTLDYIEGSKILGYIGQRMKEEGKTDRFLRLLADKELIFSNAYISRNGVRLEEVPAAFFSVKNEKEVYRNKLYGSEGNADEGKQLNQMKHCYVHLLSKKELYKYNVELEERYHHSRPGDKSIGRSINTEESKFYQISSIKAGQTFKGVISGNQENIRELAELIRKYPEMSLGYGRSSEYGACRIKIVNVKEKESHHVRTKRFYVWLKAPAIIYNSKAMYSTNAEDLIEEIAAALDIPKEKLGKKTEKYLNIVSVGGYNVTWGHRKPVMEAFDKGSVLVFEPEQEVEIPLGTIYLGERTKEGFGEAELLEAEDGCYEGMISESLAGSAEEETRESAEEALLKSDLFRKVANCQLSDFLKYHAAEDCSKGYSSLIKSYGDALRPTVSNMLLMFKEADSIEDVERFCGERFSKLSGNKEIKKKAAEDIIKKVKASKVEDEFRELYGIAGFNYEGDLLKEYLYHYLIELKYRLRSEKTEEA